MFDDVRALLRQAHDILACASYPPEHNADLTAAYEKGFYDGKKQKYIKREWVGLTDEERRRYNNRLSGSGVAEEIEAKLKEKNT